MGQCNHKFHRDLDRQLNKMVESDTCAICGAMNTSSKVESETQDSISITQQLKYKIYTYSDMLDAWIGGRIMGERCKNSTTDLSSGVLDFSSFMRKYQNQQWKCKRCGEIVDMKLKKCKCKKGPSPWEPVS